MKKHRVGMIVTIYEDPITEMVPEGRARLLGKVNHDMLGDLIYWRVRFVDTGDVVCRWVRPPKGSPSRTAKKGE